MKRLHTHHKIYLERLYPFYSFDKQPVQFPIVQLQPNGNDCGVFAIAFAVSLLFNLQPNKIIYDHNLMRQHLAEIFQSNRIKHFPQIAGLIDLKQINHEYAFNQGGIKSSLNIHNISVNLSKDQYGTKRKANHNYGDSNKKRNKNCKIFSENVLLHKTNVISLHKNKKRVLNKEYYELHKDDLLAKKKIYNEKHKNNLKKSNKAYYKKHKNNFKKLNKEYYDKHKNDFKKFRKEYKLHRNNVLIKKKIYYKNKINLSKEISKIKKYAECIKK